MSCTCQNCGRKYKVDLNVPDEIWDKIRPENSVGEGGLLCPICISERLEKLDEYDYWNLIKIDLIVEILKDTLELAYEDYTYYEKECSNAVRQIVELLNIKVEKEEYE